MGTNKDENEEATDKDVEVAASDSQDVTVTNSISMEMQIARESRKLQTTRSVLMTWAFSTSQMMNQVETGQAKESPSLLMQTRQILNARTARRLLSFEKNLSFTKVG